MTPRAVPPPGRPVPRAALGRRLAHARGTAVGFVWVATGMISAFAPDLVSGPSHRQIPLAAATAWIWAVVATCFIFLPGTVRLPRQTVLFVSGAWVVAIVLAITAPNIETSEDSTSIPLVAVVAPALAAVATGFALLAWLAAAARPGTAPVEKKHHLTHLAA